jgi:ribosomal protein S14
VRHRFESFDGGRPAGRKACAGPIRHQFMRTPSPTRGREACAAPVRPPTTHQPVGCCRVLVRRAAQDGVPIEDAAVAHSAPHPHTPGVLGMAGI